ncbi:MAG: 2-amino-4-hydroxy-6-hydroxymethyldihydropteridine diphosphokinase [Immundisolibacter sp.]
MSGQPAFIGLGGNLGDPVRQIEQALGAIAELPGTCLLKRSALYGSRPMGPAGQPDYVNAVAWVETALSPSQLLAALLDIERQHGRRRDAAERNGPRTLDLDLLLYADLVCDEPALTLPHPGAHERDFVLQPLAEIAPHMHIPGRGPVAELLAHCRRHDLRVLDQALAAAG